MNKDKNLEKIEEFMDKLKLDYTVEPWQDKYKVSIDGLVEKEKLTALKDILSSDENVTNFFIRTASNSIETHTIFYVMKGE